MRLFPIIAAAVAFAAPATAHEVIHGGHGHAHAGGCGHAAVKHAGHVDYLHDGHLHSTHAAHVDEHVLDVSARNPAAEKRVASADRHGADDGHQAVQHGAHFDHLHDGRLHHFHAGHADDHGAVATGV